jgi:hypothetical protein
MFFLVRPLQGCLKLASSCQFEISRPVCRLKLAVPFVVSEIHVLFAV